MASDDSWVWFVSHVLLDTRWGLLLWHHRTFQTLLLSSRLFGFPTPPALLSSDTQWLFAAPLVLHLFNLLKLKLIQSKVHFNLSKQVCLAIIESKMNQSMQKEAKYVSYVLVQVCSKLKEHMGSSWSCCCHQSVVLQGFHAHKVYFVWWCRPHKAQWEISGPPTFYGYLKIIMSIINHWPFILDMPWYLHYLVFKEINSPHSGLFCSFCWF